jgi:predicted RNA-binding Zn ribbon-like protein
VATALQNDAAPEQKAPEFELIGGHPTLDLVNTLDWRFREGKREELLTNYGDVVSFVEQAGLIPAIQARRLLRSVPRDKAEKIVAAVRELREAAASILYAALNGENPQASSVAQLNDSFQDAGEQLHLRWAGSKLVRELPQSPALPGLPLWLLSLETAEFMTSDQMQFLRACGNPECRWLFVDASKNHTRRWCDMKICGNRMKARRYKAQHKG